MVFDRTLSFNRHYDNLRFRALKRLNIVKIFTLANVSSTTLERLQVVLNSAFRRIHHLPLRTPITKLTKISQMMEVKDRLRYLGYRYIVKSMRINPLIQQMIAEFMRTISWINAKKKWFTGTPFAIILPLVVMAKATMIYITFTAAYIYMLEMSTDVACRGLSRGKLIYPTCVLNPKPFKAKHYSLNSRKYVYLH